MHSLVHQPLPTALLKGATRRKTQPTGGESKEATGWQGVEAGERA